MLVGHLMQARACMRAQVLDMREAALGGSHPEVAACLNNLAVLLKSVGRHAEAEQLYARAIAIKERSMGPTHPQARTLGFPSNPSFHLCQGAPNNWFRSLPNCQQIDNGSALNCAGAHPPADTPI